MIMDNQAKQQWPGPAGLIPVTSGKAEDANIHNRNFLDHILVEMRVIDAIEPDLTTEIFGQKFSSPIMMPAFSHLNKIKNKDAKPMEEYAKAAKEENLLNWVGMESDDDFGNILAVNSKTVRIIKPFADHDIILNQIAFAEQHGAIAVGIDIDHIAGTNGKYDVVDGYSMGPITLKDLKTIVEKTRLPFVAKGVLSVSDALKACEAGCKAIVVSHHHGRIPFGIPPAYALPKIKDALAGSNIKIFADCGIESGYDAYKLLALGADAVSVGRAILSPLLKEGKDGVIKQIKKMHAELSELMMYTGIKDTRTFDANVLHY